MKKSILKVMCHLSDAFFSCNGRTPCSMDELRGPDDNLSVSERSWVDLYSQLWDATLALESEHSATYEIVEVEPDVIRALTPTCEKSGLDFRLAKEAYGTSVWIETPNGLVSICYDIRTGATCVSTYDGGAEKAPPENQVVMKKIMKPMFEVGKWNRWADYDLGHNWIYDEYTGRRFSVGCVSLSTHNDMPNEENPCVYRADDVEGVSALFDMAGVAHAAAKASGCDNSFFVFKLLP